MGDLFAKRSFRQSDALVPRLRDPQATVEKGQKGDAKVRKVDVRGLSLGL
jgi:hypothetical protein